MKALFEQRALLLCLIKRPTTTRREREREREREKKKKKKKKKKKEERESIIIMAWTNFVITGVAIVAVASLMRSDVRTSTAMLRRNVKTLRQMMEEAVSNTDAAKRSAKEEATKKLKK